MWRRMFAICALFLFLGTSAAQAEDIWSRAVARFGADAQKYLYLALPYKSESRGETLFPVEAKGKRYYLKSATYSVAIREGAGALKRYRVDFSVDKREIPIWGEKDNIPIFIGERELYDISFKVAAEGRVRVCHNYFAGLPNGLVTALFPGFLESDTFAIYSKREGWPQSGYVGFKIEESGKSYIRLDPYGFTDIQGIKEYEEGERDLFGRGFSTLDKAISGWETISELEVWTLLNRGVDEPRHMNLTGILQILFEVKPLKEPLLFGNKKLPFSSVRYEVDYSLSSEYARAAMLLSPDSLIPKRSHFSFKKRLVDGEMILDMDIEVERVVLVEADRL